MKVSELQNERNQIFKDVYDGKQPKRIPIEIAIEWDAAIPYCGMDLRKTQWNSEKYATFFDRICSEFSSDKLPITPTMRTPQPYQILGSRAFVMSKTGTMQHPEVHCLEPHEYTAFSEDPYTFMVETLMPRLFEGQKGSGAKASLNLAKAYKAKCDINTLMRTAANTMIKKYGFCNIADGPLTEAPLDILADQMRSFTGIISDIRRFPEEVKKACEAVLPHMIKLGLSKNSSRYARTFIPLHMGPFLNEKQFSTFWWPTFYQLMEELKANGAGVKIFVEQNWMKKIDYLETLTDRVEMQFEFGDAKLIKEKVGKDHIISGLFPITMLQTSTKQQCVDKAKELIDTLAPGGGYIFNTDKSVYSLDGPIADNFKAVIDTVRTYGVY